MNRVKIDNTEYALKGGVYTKVIPSTRWQVVKRVLHEIRCGWHSGFSLCCIMWFVLPWKLILRRFSPKKEIRIIGNEIHEVWPVDYRNFYHRLMDARQPYNDMPDLCPTDIEFIAPQTSLAHDYKIVRVKDWGMIPCPYHLWRRRRNTVRTCFHGEFMKWTPETKAKALKEHPELCVKD